MRAWRFLSSRLRRKPSRSPRHRIFPRSRHTCGPARARHGRWSRMTDTRSVLIVDDDERFRERLARAVADRGYTVHSAENHHSALRTAKAHVLDRVIVDLRMPGPDGLQVIRDLLALRPPFEIPSLARLEREHIERVLRECGGNISKTARILGVHRRTLQYKLAKYPVTR